MAPVPLKWTPPALAQLSAQALASSSFTLDRSMLTAAAGLMGDSDPGATAAIAKLDGVSVHVLRFANTAPADPARRGGHPQRLSPDWLEARGERLRQRRWAGARCQNRCVGGDGRRKPARRGGVGGRPQRADAGHRMPAI